MTLVISTTQHSHDPQSAPTVMTVQHLLHGKGYYNGRFDGIFGPLCEQGTKDLQSHVGIRRDGIVGKETWQHLNTHVQPASVSASDFVDRLVRRTLGRDGHPAMQYVYGDKPKLSDPFPLRSDCSGLMCWGIYQDAKAVWVDGSSNQAARVHRISVAQALTIKGAFLFESHDGTPGGVHHVAASLGNNEHSVEAHSAHTKPETGVFAARGRFNLAGFCPALHY